MTKSELKINEQSIKTELKAYKDKPYKCIFEYIWNSFDAGSTEVSIDYEMPKEGIGIVQELQIRDNGKGWDFENHAVTNNFISSTKKPIKNKTLPKGQYGRGRYAFIWIAKKIEVYSKKKKLTLQHNTNILKEDSNIEIDGTNIKFINIEEDLSYMLLAIDSLHQEIILNFGWFLLENKNYKIKINGEEVNISSNIKEIKTLKNDDFNDVIQKKVDDFFKVRIVLWDKKPSEYSKYYFINENGIESFKQNTGLNKKSDNFWHSVYIESKLFKSIDDIEDKQVDNQQIIDFSDKEIKRTQKQILDEIKKEIVLLRKPYLIEQSNYLLKELKEENIMPNLNEFGIYDEKSYDELLKTIYTISPSLFVNKSESEKKFICATFAGLLSNQDDTLIKTILEQLQELSEEEKNDLLDILNRSSLSNMIKTIKEVDHRLEVIDKLKLLISEYEKETLEVKHIQKILDENFWLFGEQFRLFSTTEGALKNVLVKYAKEILNIEEPELNTQPNGEVDLFLTKTESVGEKVQKNIVVEIKRASKKLKQNIEYTQIDNYRKKILEQNLCNGEKQYWEFHLIGKCYDEDIAELIENAKQHGELEKGLVLNIKNGRVKIYVRKWSDILEVEWGTKMKYLKEKLEIKSKNMNESNPDIITQKLISNKK